MQVSEADNMTQHAHVYVRACISLYVHVCVWLMWIISIQLISVTRAC